MQILVPHFPSEHMYAKLWLRLLSFVDFGQLWYVSFFKSYNTVQ